MAEPLETSLPSHLGGDSSRSDPLSTDPRRVIHVQERLAKLCTVTFVVVQRRPTRARPSQRPKPVRLKRLCWLHAADGSEPAHGLKIWVPTGRPERANSALDRPVVHLQTACSEQERVRVLARSVAFNPGQPFSPLPYRAPPSRQCQFEMTGVLAASTGRHCGRPPPALPRPRSSATDKQHRLLAQI